MRGAVATSQPLAALEAVRALQLGGNAVDAAVTASVLLGVLEPMQAGMGGDVMALVYEVRTGRLHGLNGAGRSGAAVDAARVRAQAGAGASQVPLHSVHAVNVPGAVAAWLDLLDRFGNFDRQQALAPAIRAAEQGFAVAPQTAATWAMGAPLLATRRASAKTWLTSSGKAPSTAEVFRNERLASSLRLVSEGGRAAFYDGPLAAAIVAEIESEGGSLTRGDFLDHRSSWVEPLLGRYRGRQIAQMPPSTQGIAVLEALALYEASSPNGADPIEPDAVHHQVEAIKAAFVDAGEHLADPPCMRVTPDWILDPDRIATVRRERMRPGASESQPIPRTGGDTAFVCVADGLGNVAAVMASLFHPWGSGITAGDTGILLQNRGHGFTLEQGHPNELAPGKRPRHTILPAMMLADGRPQVAFGFVGGDMQVQAQLQFVCNVVDRGMNLQQALDAPRWRFEGQGHALALEAELGDLRAPLAARGHDVLGDAGFFGGGQAVGFDAEHGTYTGASDARRDGCALAY